MFFRIDFSPLSTIRVDPPGPPVELVIFAPATLPESPERALELFPAVRSSLPTVVELYPSSLCSLFIPNAVTTVPSSSFEESFIFTVTGPSATGTSCVPYPTACTTRMLFGAGTSSSKLPSGSETVPVEVFLTAIPAPGRPRPFSSRTLPFTCLDCANAS